MIRMETRSMSGFFVFVLERACFVAGVTDPDGK